MNTSYSFTQENPTLVNIPYQVFVNGGKNDFQSILYQDDTLQSEVKKMYSQGNLYGFDLLPELSDFKSYWKKFKNNWFYIQFKKEGKPLLLFKGLKTSGDEREFVEIYAPDRPADQLLLFSSVGRLLAYKKHPFTNHLILFVHQYPCCRSASHTIYTIREIKNKIKQKSRFFVGRDNGDMVGPFFPEKVHFDNVYHKLNKRTELRWSPEVVNENAFLNWTQSNLIIHYEKGAIYKILYEKEGWQFVLFLSGIAEEQSMMLNYTNFKNKGVYGWIKK